MIGSRNAKRIPHPEEVREWLVQRDRQHAAMRAAAPPDLAEFYVRMFPPVSDADFRRVMEKALLGRITPTGFPAAARGLLEPHRTGRCFHSVKALRNKKAPLGGRAAKRR